MKKLNLIGLKGTYTKVNDGNKEIYYNTRTNNMIIFYPFDDSCNTHSICNGIADDAYNYLIKTLNKNKDVAVFWSQIEATTSDYNIYHEVWNKTLHTYDVEEIVVMLDDLINGERKNVYKYTEIKDGEEEVIKFNRENVTNKINPKGKFIDHIDCHKQHNVIENLRLI